MKIRDEIEKILLVMRSKKKIFGLFLLQLEDLLLMNLDKIDGTEKTIEFLKIV